MDGSKRLEFKCGAELEQSGKDYSYRQRLANHARQENLLLVGFHAQHLLLLPYTNFGFVRMPLQMSVRNLYASESIL